MRHYYCGACLKHFDFTDKWLVKNCPLCDRPVTDITFAVKDKQRFLQEAQDLVAQQAVKNTPDLPTQMRGIGQFYASSLLPWEYKSNCYGVRVEFTPPSQGNTLRLSVYSVHRDPFVDLERKTILSLAAYLLDYLNRTQEKV